MSKLLSILRQPAVWLLVLTALLLWWGFGRVAEHPGAYLFGDGGDALKNYYTFLYHIQHGRGTHFTGMMYPYGDHLVYADGQPLLAIPLGWVASGMSLSTGLWLTNVLLLASMLLTAWLLYRILRANLVSAGPAVVGAVLIVFLSPQFDRILGHYALSYCFLVPLYWYLLIKAFERPRSWRPLAAYVLVAFCAGLLHPYWVSMAALLALAYALVALLQRRRSDGYSWGLVGRVALAGLLPVVLFQLFMFVTDPVRDRPETPWGFFTYRAYFDTIFFPVLDPLATYWRQAFHTEEHEWEGRGYVGLVGLVVLLLTAIRAVRYLVRLRWRLVLRPVLPLPLRIGIFAAVLTLLFACGIPFTWGLEGLLQLIKPLKQFRSIGRFAWVFYYVYTVYTVYYLYQLGRYLQQRRAGQFAWSLVLIPLLVWGWEARTVVNTVSNYIPGADRAPDWLTPPKTYLDELSWANIRPDQFQAILPLPFYLIGPEVNQPVMGQVAYESMRASLHTGLPLVAASMSRASQSRSLALLQLLSDDVVPKTALKDFPSQKPLLLLVTNETLKPAEKLLIAKARPLLHTDRVTLYELPLSAFDASAARQQALAAATSTPPRPDLVRKSWPRAQTASPLGTGTFLGQNETELFTGTVPQAVDTAHYEISVWVNNQGFETLPTLKVQELAPGSDQVLNTQEMRAALSTDISGAWLRPAVRLRLQNPQNRIRVLLQADRFEAADVLVRPAYVDTYDQPVPGRWSKNNFPLSE